MKTDKQILPHVWNAINLPKIGNGAAMNLPDCGNCTVIWTRDEGSMEHVSVSPTRKYKIPSWNDMCKLKDIFFDDEEEVYQIHPPKSEYVNLDTNCLHLWRPANGERLKR